MTSVCAFINTDTRDQQVTGLVPGEIKLFLPAGGGFRRQNKIFGGYRGLKDAAEVENGGRSKGETRRTLE